MADLGTTARWKWWYSVSTVVLSGAASAMYRSSALLSYVQISSSLKKGAGKEKMRSLQTDGWDDLLLVFPLPGQCYWAHKCQPQYHPICPSCTPCSQLIGHDPSVLGCLPKWKQYKYSKIVIYFKKLLNLVLDDVKKITLIWYLNNAEKW